MTLAQRAANAYAWSQRHGMVLVVLALLGWMWALTMWFNAQQKQQLLADRGAELSLMADAVAQHSAGILHGVESDLRTLDLWLVTHPEADPLRDTRFLVLIEEMRRSSHGQIDVRMLSDSGDLYYLPALDGQPRANVADREYFKVHLTESCANACAAHVGAPVRSRVTQRWDIPVSLKLSVPAISNGSKADGGKTVLRTMFAAISLDRLAGEHERMRFQPDGAITLVRADGKVLSRAPAVPAFVGLDLSGSVHFGDEFGRRARGSFVSDGAATDHIERLVSYERLEDFPVTVLVSRSLAEIHETYSKRIRNTLFLSGLLSAALLGFTLFLHKSRCSQQAMIRTQEHFRRLASTDELTGVLNRRAFMDAASREFERAQRYLRPTAVLALDIDHFKHINDEYGHSGGDLALQACASRWQLALREHDVLGRIGGEEFCVLLPETSGEGAHRIAERLRVLTAALPIMGMSKMVSVSIGWAVVEATDRGWSDVLARADRALYAAKNEGRNCVRPELESDGDLGRFNESAERLAV